MIAPTACPRCAGRLIVERDRHGVYADCLTCGAHTDLDCAGTPLAPLGRVLGERVMPLDREATHARRSEAQRNAWARRYVEGRR